jgi:hypothetical protein
MLERAVFLRGSGRHIESQLAAVEIRGLLRAASF